VRGTPASGLTPTLHDDGSDDETGFRHPQKLNIRPDLTGPICESRLITGTLKSDERTGWKPEWIHDGEVIICPWHGMEFHVPTGNCLTYEQVRLRRYEVSLDGSDVVIHI
jgi:hypothetical protein